MVDPGKKSKTRVWVIPVMILSAILVCVVGGFFLFRESEARETGNRQSYAITALTCTAVGPKETFFSSGSAISDSHTVKMTFKDKHPDKISYIYSGDFRTKEKAENIISSYHANYNLDMSKYNLDPESLTPSFVAVDKEAKINLYIAASNLNPITAKFFFLDSTDQNKIQTYSEKDIQKIYENVGFKCEYKNY